MIWMRRLALAGLFFSCLARADPGYYVVTAYDNAGQRSIDFRYWTVALPHSAHVVWPEIGFGYGVNSRWYTELYASYITSSQMPTQLSTMNWQNEVLLTQGEWPFDLALHLKLSQYHGSENGYIAEYGPVFQTDVGRTQLNANFFFKREFGTDDAGPTELDYQWQIRHRWRPVFQFGAQGFGEIGTWNHWPGAAQQSHRAGPAVFGTLDLGQNQALLYQAAYLWGRVYGRSGNMLTVRTQYVF